MFFTSPSLTDVPPFTVSLQLFIVCGRKQLSIFTVCMCVCVCACGSLGALD